MVFLGSPQPTAIEARFFVSRPRRHREIQRTIRFKVQLIKWWQLALSRNLRTGLLRPRNVRELYRMRSELHYPGLQVKGCLEFR